MSRLQKMSVQGIRSFGNRDQDTQVITFFSPLTLIVGPNGSGKTTIIECLKYMATGVMPPGAKTGGAFVHDPKVAHDSEVRGQIRLLFQDTTGHPVQVQRTLVATQKKSSVALRTLEGIIIREGPNGEPVQITSKCAELDREMVSAFGVSTAILENVIFCHQEESNWPLSEGKALKSKFDDIFAATKYMKALEHLRKIRTEQMTNLKVSKAEIGHLKAYRDMAIQKKRQYSEVDERRKTSKTTVDTIKQKLEPIENRLDFIGKESSKMNDFQRRMDRLTNDRDTLQKQIRELKAMIEEPFTGTHNELKSLISNFEKEQEKKKRELKDNETQRDTLERQMKVLNDKRTQMTNRLGGLEFEEKQCKEKQKQRQQFLEDISQQNSISDSSVKSIQTFLDKSIKEEQQNLTEKRLLYTQQEKVLQQDLDKLNEKRIKLQSQIRLKHEQIEKNIKELSEIKTQMKTIEQFTRQLNDLDTKIIQKENEFQTKSKQINIDELKQNIGVCEQKRTQIQFQLKDLNIEMDKLLTNTKLNTEYEMFKKEKHDREEQIRKIKIRNQESLISILGTIPTSDTQIRPSYDSEYKKLQQTRGTFEKKLNDSKQLISAKEEKRKYLQQDLKTKEADVQKSNDQLYTALNGQASLENYLGKIQHDLNGKQDEKGQFVGLEKTYTRFINKVKNSMQSEPCCPLCLRTFEQLSDGEQLIAEMEAEIRRCPDKRKQLDKEIEILTKQQAQCLSLQPVQELVERLEQTDIPNIKKDMKKLDQEIIQLKSQTQEIEQSLSKELQSIEICDQIKTDITNLDRFCGEIKEFDMKIKKCQEKMGINDKGQKDRRTIDQVKTETNQLQSESEHIDKELQTKHSQLRKQQDLVQELRESLTELKNEKLKLSNQVGKKDRLDEQQKKLQEQNQTLKEEIKDDEQALQPLIDDIDLKQTQRKKMADEKETQLNKISKTMTAMQEKQTELRTLTDAISNFEDNRSHDLTELRSSIEKLNQTQKQHQKDLSDRRSTITQHKDDLARSEIRYRQMSDQSQLFTKQQELEKKEIDFAELEEKTHGLKLDTLTREEKKLRQEQEQLIKEKLTAIGRLQTFEQQIKELQDELDQEQFKNANEKYLKHFMEQKVLEYTSQDLEKFYKVLDQTMMTYHSQKMAQLNKIIRELWRTTYRGTDIDAIEIRSDADMDNAIKTRRTYNYRVVMLKSNSVMDMRGRCSAGQKVLASLIIRLALAEAFCLNCGILALDEPTTNLDFENINGLAQALIEIVKSRASMKHFQLVVITHDEDFVDSLGRSAYAEKLYRVSKTPTGYSKIDLCNMSTFGH